MSDPTLLREWPQGSCKCGSQSVDVTHLAMIWDDANVCCQKSREKADCHVRALGTLPRDRKFYITEIIISGINLGIEVHYLYRKNPSAEIVLLYIRLSRPRLLGCISFCSHHVTLKVLEGNQFCNALHYGHIKICFQICNVIISGHTVRCHMHVDSCTVTMHTDTHTYHLSDRPSAIFRGTPL